MIEDQTSIELETLSPAGLGASLPMYYAFYYQPLFWRFGRREAAPYVFTNTKMNEWIDKMRMTPEDQHEFSAEAHAFFDLARSRNELVWTMTTLVAGLNACLNRKEALLVLSTALSLCYDPRCILPMDGGWFDTDIPSRVAVFFDNASATALQRPRYGLDCTLGRRLREDYLLMSHLADRCGIQEEMYEKLGSKASTGQPSVDLTLALVALISQSSSWRAEMVEGARFIHPPHRILFYNASLHVDPFASLVVDFLYAIQSAGIRITVYRQDSPSPLGEEFRGSDDQPWHQSGGYRSHLKTRSWWPTTNNYFNVMRCELSGGDELPECSTDHGSDFRDLSTLASC